MYRVYIRRIKTQSCAQNSLVCAILAKLIRSQTANLKVPDWISGLAMGLNT